MVKFICRNPPNTLSGFVQADVPDETIDQVVADFKRGAFDDCNPTVRLSLNRQRFQGKSAELIRDALNVEGDQAPFLLIDKSTTNSRSVWWIDQWLDEKMNESEKTGWIADNLEKECLEQKERILLKVKVPTLEAPDFYTNISTGNISIFETIPYPYNPHALQVPHTVYDWEHNPPQPSAAIVIAAPHEYEVSSASQDLRSFLMPNGKPPREVFRLKKEVAETQGLKNDWSADVRPCQEQGMPAGSVKFSQGWDV